MDLLLLAAAHPTSTATPTDGASTTDTGGLIVAALGLVLSLVVAIVGWVQLRGAKDAARDAKKQADAAKEQADAAKRIAGAAQRQTAAAEAAAVAARDQAEAAIAALQWETIPQLEVTVEPGEEILDLTVDPPVPTQTSTWRVRNTGKADAIRLRVAMDFDPDGSKHGTQTFDVLRAGEHSLLQAYRGIFPSFEQSRHDGEPPTVELFYTTQTSEARSETKSVIRHDPRA